MKLEPGQFDAWENKRVTLLGLSGVGKTRLATLLRKHDWFHYSGDYRIGTRYLDEAILDNVKQQVMGVPFLRKLLRSDSIYISNNITVDNLSPVSSFLGKVGNPERGGLPLKEFKRRQSLHRMAEIAAMKDVPEFIRKARDIYGYRHFVNDACAGLCELDDPNLIEVLAEHTLILYVEATDRNEPALLQRARERPMLFREAFLDEQLSSYMKEYLWTTMCRPFVGSKGTHDVCVAGQLTTSRTRQRQQSWERRDAGNVGCCRGLDNQRSRCRVENLGKISGPYCQTGDKSRWSYNQCQTAKRPQQPRSQTDHFLGPG